MLRECKQNFNMRKVLRRMVSTEYDVAVEELKTELNNVKFVSLSLTTDLWSSLNSESYIGVSCHYYTDVYELRSCVTEAKQIVGQHTAELIAEKLGEVVEFWDLTGKVVAIITDNAANMKAAIRLVGSRHFSCFAHTLHLAVTQALDSVDEFSQLREEA